MIKYRYTNENQSIEVLNTSAIPDGVSYETIEFDPNEGEALRLLAEKQALIDGIKLKQQKAMGDNSDIWAIKLQDSENDDDLTTDEKKEVKKKAKQVTKWRKLIRTQNNDISTSNTLAEIQARLDAIDAYVAIFPYATQADYNTDSLGFRS